MRREGGDSKVSKIVRGQNSQRANSQAVDILLSDKKSVTLAQMWRYVGTCRFAVPLLLSNTPVGQSGNFIPLCPHVCCYITYRLLFTNKLFQPLQWWLGKSRVRLLPNLAFCRIKFTLKWPLLWWVLHLEPAQFLLDADHDHHRDHWPLGDHGDDHHLAQDRAADGMKQQTFSFTQNTAILKFSMSNFSVKYYSETRKTDSQSQKSRAKKSAKTLWFSQKNVG